MTQSSRVIRRSERLWQGLLLASLYAAVGCASDTTGPAPVSPDRLYTQLTIDQHHGITLALTAPYDTLQLTTTPSSAAGTTLTDSSRTTWTSNDTTSVQVSSSGLLRALAPTNGLLVIASRQIGGITHADTAFVNVNAIPTPVPVASQVTFAPTLCFFGDPVQCAVNNVYTFVPTVLDRQGQVIADVALGVTTSTPFIQKMFVAFTDNGKKVWTSSGTNINTIDYSGGNAVLFVDATVYGTRVTDSISIRIPWPQVGLILMVPRQHTNGSTLIGTFTPAEDTIGVGGVVIWQNELPGNALADVVFDDSSAAQAVDSATFLGGSAGNFVGLGGYIPNEGGGNIRPFTPLDTAEVFGRTVVTAADRARRFMVAGTYRYHSATYGTSGILHVVQ